MEVVKLTMKDFMKRKEEYDNKQKEIESNKYDKITKNKSNKICGRKKKYKLPSFF